MQQSSKRTVSVASSIAPSNHYTLYSLLLLLLLLLWHQHTCECWFVLCLLPWPPPGALVHCTNTTDLRTTTRSSSNSNSNSNS
jgi:hypothetical protein